LLARQGSGQGQHIDLALFDVAVATMLNFNHYYLAAKADPPRLGNEHPTAVPMALIDTSTGPFYLALANDRLFKVLCETVLQRPDIVQDAKFASNPARVANRGELMSLLRPLFTDDTRENWLRRLQEAGLPSGAIRTISENLTSQDVADRNLVTNVPHPTAGTVELVHSPLNLSATPVANPVAPPLLGQHTHEVLQDLLGYDQAQLDQLRQHQAIR
jgi:crotonobetainyl-CoA:carnitine CoA-transferase CaiB-like acyl-CoA transferase